MFATQTVRVYRPTASGTDRFNNAVETFDSGTDVDVLVAPTTTNDLDADRPDGVARRMQLHFPKTWTSSLRGCEVGIGGKRWRVVGDPWPYMAANTPGEFWMPVDVELANG